jgi:hypothetical protein
VGAKAHALRASSQWSALLPFEEDTIMTVTNFRRADRAAKLFDRYATGEHAGIFDLTSLVLADLLTDLMHFAEFQTLDFERCLEKAKAAYAAQAGAEDAGPGGGA